MTIAEFFNLSPEQIARANEALAAVRAGLANLQKTVEPAVTRAVKFAHSPELCRYFRPYIEALSKLTQDPEWRAMVEGAAKMSIDPYRNLVPTINAPARQEHENAPVEVQPHRRTGFKLPGVNDDK